MTRKRFRWTRDTYKAADRMARFYGRHIYELPERPPLLLQRFFDLWDRHPQLDDPLLIPMRQRARYTPDSDIPF